MSDIGEFSKFTELLDKHALYPLVPILAINVVLDYFFALQPPWPKSSTYVTAFLEISTIFIAFCFRPRNKLALFRLQITIFFCLITLFLSYFLFYSLFVFETPLNGTKVVGGFECTYDAREYVSKALREDCPFLSEEALSLAQFDAEKVWTRRSIVTVEFALFVSWSLFFILSTFLSGISVAYLSRKTSKVSK